MNTLNMTLFPYFHNNLFQFKRCHVLRTLTGLRLAFKWWRKMVGGFKSPYTFKPYGVRLVQVPPPGALSVGAAGAPLACACLGTLSNIIVVAAEMAKKPALLIACLRVIVFLPVALLPEKSSVFVFILIVIVF